jgi:hypothetical protein
MRTLAPEMSWRLFAADPDVAEMLTVSVLRKANLGSIRFGLEYGKGW